MKKGFTLIELLIVMVVVGILVTVTLPKYNASLERGRSMEALNNLKAASEAVNARYVLNGNAYTSTGVTDNSGNFITGDFARARYFGAVTWPTRTSTTTADLVISRDGGDYTLTAHNEAGELKYITCAAGAGVNASICENIGAELTSGSYRMDFGQ